MSREEEIGSFSRGWAIIEEFYAEWIDEHCAWSSPVLLQGVAVGGGQNKSQREVQEE